MGTYYCLVAGLPDISLDDGKLSYSVADFRSDLYPELSAADQKLVNLFYLQYDNADLLTLLRNKDAETAGKGNFSTEELSLLIGAVRDGDSPDKRYPAYMADFITRYIQLPAEDLYRAEDMLSSLYHVYAMSCGNSLISSWFEFNLNVNNILAALTARKYKMDVAPAIVGNTEVCEQLRSSNSRDFGLNELIDYFEPVQRIAEVEDLVEREKRIDQLKWKWLADESFFHYFTVERLFVFLLQLEMIERWISLDKDKGSELFRQLIDNLKNEVQIPEEFRK